MISVHFLAPFAEAEWVQTQFFALAASTGFTKNVVVLVVDLWLTYLLSVRVAVEWLGQLMDDPWPKWMLTVPF